MASYNGTTIYIRADSKDGTIARPRLVSRSYGVQRTLVPFANYEQLQFMGRGNSTLTLSCEIYSESDFESLLALVGDGIARTIVNPFGDGVNYINMLLVDLPANNVWQVSFGTPPEIHFDMVFERVPGL